MPESSYVPGPLAAVVTSRIVLLTDGSVPADVLRGVWDAAALGAGPDEVVVALTTGLTAAFPGSSPTTPDTLPPFALASLEGDLVRVVTRSGVSVAVGDARGPHQLVARGVGRPWVSEVVPVPQVLWLGQVVDSPDVLPLTAGVVRAGWLAWCPHPVDAGDAVLPAPAPSFADLLATDPPVTTPSSGFAAEFFAEPTVSSPFAPGGTLLPATGELPVAGLPPLPTRPGRLRFSDGLVVDVVEVLRIGRAPSLDGPGQGRAVTVSNPTREISRNHVEVRPEGAGVVVVDLGSANGTVVTAPGEAPQRLEPHRPYPLGPGAVVALSADVHAVYEVD